MAVCFDQRVGKIDMKRKSNCASDESLTLANGFFGVELYQLGLALRHLQIIFGEELLSIPLPISSFTMI